MQEISFGSVCSGIEAASVAWHDFGWRCAWVAEVEPSPCVVLAHHYGASRPEHPLDPEAEGLSDEDRDGRRAMLAAVMHLPQRSRLRNLGDMTKIRDLVLSGEVEAPDVLVGGTPCQSFSVAGLRGGLQDQRGNLALEYVRLLDAIDHIRRDRGLPECVGLWENVPGVFGDKDNAFGCILAALAGCDSPILAPPGRGWCRAGLVLGPSRAVAWRTLDAQYFGVAQRRARVFVVASARAGLDPASVLQEPGGLRRDHPPRRKARKVAAARAEAGPREDGERTGLELVDALPDVGTPDLFR